MKRQLILWLTSIVALSILPLLLGTYWTHVMIIGYYFAVLTVSWSITAILGKANFGFAALPMIGAYTSALTSIYLGLPPLLTILLGGLVAAAFGYLLGRATMKLSGPYFGLTTFAVAEAIRIPIIVEYQWTRGTLGLFTPPLLGAFSTDLKPAYLFVAGFFIIVMFITYRLLKSKIGLFTKAMGDNELAASSVGIDTTRTLTMVTALMSLFAGIAGAIYGHYIGVVTPDIGSTNNTGLIVAMGIIGGLGGYTLVGPVVGAMTLEVLSEYLRAYALYRWVLFGALIIVVLRFFPKGLYPYVASWGRRLYVSLRGRKPGS